MEVSCRKDLLNDLMSHGGLLSLLVFFTFVVVGILFLLQLLSGIDLMTICRLQGTHIG